MKKLIKWILILGSLLVTVVVAAIILIPMFVDVQSYKPEIEKKVSEVTGRPFTLGGDLNLSVFPWVGISFSELSLGNPDGFQEKNFVKIRSFEARVKLLPLLSKEIEVKQFVIDGPEIFLERKGDGQANWEGMGKEADAGAGKDAAAPSEKKKKEPSGDAGEGIPIKSLVVGEFAVTNGRVYFSDQTSGTKKEISDINLRLTDITLDKQIGISFQAMVDSKPVALNGKVGPIGKEPGKGTFNLDILVEALNQLSVQVKGSLVDPAVSQKFDIALDIAPFSPKKLMSALGQEFPVKTTDPGVLEKVALSLKVKGDPANIAISDGLLTLDDSQLQFLAAVKEMTKPDVHFNLKLNSINLDRYLPPPSDKKPEEVVGVEKPKGAGGGEAGPEEKKKIDYDPLRKLVLEGEVHVGELIAHGAKIQDFEMKIVGRDGVFTLDPFKLNLYEGSVSTVGTLNVQGDVPKTSVNLQTKGVQVGPLLRDSVKQDVLEGGVAATVALTLEGDEPEMIKRTLNGKGDLLFEDGAVVGIDIAGMVRNVKSSFAGGEKSTEKPRTDFAELHVPFTLTNGLFNTPAANLSSPLLRVSVAGDADLVKETLDFRVKPKVVGTLKGQGDAEKRSGVMVPVIVEGTFQKPEFRADMEGLIGDVAPKKEELLEVLTNPDSEKSKDTKSSMKEKGKSIEEQGKSLLKGFGFGN